jgi:hypothetical protein
MKKLCMFWYLGAGCFLWGRKFRGPEVPGRFREKFRAKPKVSIHLAQREPGSSGPPGSSGGRKFWACPEVPGCVFLCVTGRIGGALYKVPLFPNERGFHTSEISPFLRALFSSPKPKNTNTCEGKLSHGSRVHLLTSSIVPLLSHSSIALVDFVGI